MITEMLTDMLINRLTFYPLKSIVEKKEQEKVLSVGSRRRFSNHVGIVCKKPIYVPALSSTFDYGKCTRATVIRKKRVPRIFFNSARIRLIR